MTLTKPPNRMDGSYFASDSDVTAGLTVGLFIRVAGVLKEVVSTGEDETVNGNKLRNIPFGNISVRSKGSNYTVVASDKASLIRTTATLTLSLTAAATLGNGWYVDVLVGAGVLTIDPNGAETINGSTALAITVDGSVRIRCNGTEFYTQFLVSGTASSDVVDDTTPQAGGVFDMNGFTMEFSKGADVASASELLLLQDGNSVDVPGTSTITSIEDTADVIGIGSLYALTFVAALTIIHHATNLIMPGGVNITTKAGDTMIVQKYASGQWRCISFSGISATADWEAGTSTKPSLASPANVKAAIDALSFEIGNGQTWQDLSASRTHSTSYQNTMGRTIGVAWVTNGSGVVPIEVSPDNSSWRQIGNSQGGETSSSTEVPDGWYYRINGSTSIIAWTELR